ncbi:hypothetical protein C1H23_08040 [Brucella melitensis]|nr:hypothetical protein C1H23_08040 [Brucella melitensis]AXX12440.1 hypothetical protein C1H24_08060 [Brucella melitensis]
MPFPSRYRKCELEWRLRQGFKFNTDDRLSRSQTSADITDGEQSALGDYHKNHAYNKNCIGKIARLAEDAEGNMRKLKKT